MAENIYQYKHRSKKKTKIKLKKKFFNLMNSAVFWKTLENVGKHKTIRLVTAGKKETVWCQNQIFVLKKFLQNIS